MTGIRNGTRSRVSLGRQFWLFWTAGTVSALGDGLRIMVIPLLAALQTRRPESVAVVSIGGQLPWFLIGPFTGVAADRLNRRRTLWVTDLLRAVLATAFAVIIAIGQRSIAVLAIYSFLLGSAQTLRDNSALAFLPEIVDEAKLNRTNSLLQSMQLLMMDFVGPPLAGIIVAVSIVIPLGMDALTFALAALLVIMIPSTAVSSAPVTREGRRGGLGGDLRKSLTWFVRNGLILRLCLLLGVTNFVVQGIMAIFVLYCTVTLHGSAFVYALALAIIGAGTAGGTLLAERLVNAVGQGNVLVVCTALTAATVLTAGLVPDALAAGALLAVVGGCIGVTNVITTSLRQILVPPSLRGQINSYYRFVLLGLGPLGAGGAGLLAQHLGLRAPFQWGALLMALASVALLPRTVRVLRRAVQIPSQAPAD